MIIVKDYHKDTIFTWCALKFDISVSINGELAGFFQSERGLQQDYSLSPYLYVIASNVLSRVLNCAVGEEHFGYHPTCHNVEVTYLSFTNDILVFSDGKPILVSRISEVFMEFAVISSLNINASKSSLL